VRGGETARRRWRRLALLAFQKGGGTIRAGNAL
jgi:hypothetical protein